MDIKLIALDLDRTTLTSEGKLSDRNRKALEAAIAKGIYVVIATGRVFSALPEEILSVKEIQYALTSNGANIVSLESGTPIYSNYIAEGAVCEIAEVLSNYDFMIEVFANGNAYVDKYYWDNIETVGLPERSISYVLNTRKPVEGIIDFMLEHKNVIENVNVNFGDMESKVMMGDVLSKIKHVTLTSSFDHNLELGGETTSKATALQELCGLLNIETQNIMACGDSPNDGAMLSLAGFPVAVANAKDEIKRIAKYIAGSNDDDGVGEAIEKFAL